MSDFMFAQIKRIEIEKWYEGTRRKCDPGNEFVIWWILHYGSWFRSAWDNSLCTRCSNKQQCGHEVRTECNIFDYESNA